MATELEKDLAHAVDVCRDSLIYVLTELGGKVAAENHPGVIIANAALAEYRRQQEQEHPKAQY